MTNRGLYIEVGRRIRAAREAAGLSQEALSESVGLSRTSITNIEAGGQQMPLHVAVRIAQALDQPIDELLPPPAEPSKKQDRIPADVSPKTAALLHRLAAQGT